MATTTVAKRLIPHFLIILLCALLYNHTTIVHRQKQQLEVPVTEATKATMGTTATFDSGDVKEIFGVKIESKPSQSKLDNLGVSSWPKWGCGPSKFPWTFSATETMYLLEGKVKVSCDGHDEAFEIGAGDLVQFPKGMKITWHVIEAVNKHYNLEK